ncbi:hypothetical protein PTTG_28825 [Puccinia triticina 1-1 BBBD Race 1]|uniref:Uncharacterized protein n=1 Tax=Puccinia triticina (isolate 1-1 / race 1 (BBBD)) TaxID=630390 RepID=A0A180G9Q0_PUCT1|nr:hypothetical protein PTTG_28825 [Puccinia triticina 1-1 BBBD Race 1]
MPPQEPNSAPSKTKKKPIPWDRDGVDGGKSSIEIVFEWLSTGNNYERWRGDKEKGKTKTRLCSEIVREMNLRGITHRDNDASANYGAFTDFLKNTGKGIMENDTINGVRTVQDRIHELCRYWDILDPIMGARSVTEPLHIRLSVGGDQPGHRDSPEPNNKPTPAEPITPLIQGTNGSKSTSSDGSDLPEVSALMPQRQPLPSAAAPVAQKTKQVKRKTVAKQPTTRSSTQASRNRQNNTEELYMRSIFSKQQAEITRARAKASKVKVAYMKELREQGLGFDKIEARTIIEFPHVADMKDGDDNFADDSDESL